MNPQLNPRRLCAAALLVAASISVLHIASCGEVEPRPGAGRSGTWSPAVPAGADSADYRVAPSRRGGNEVKSAVAYFSWRDKGRLILATTEANWTPPPPSTQQRDSRTATLAARGW